MKRPWILLGACLALSCGRGDGGDDDGTDSAGTDTGMDVPANVMECAQETVCGVVSAFSGDPGFDPPTSYTDAQVCALQRLASGEALRIVYSDGCEGMCYGSVLLVRSDGSVIVQAYAEIFEGDGVDVGGLAVELDSFENSQLCQLKPASYFTGCLGAFDASCASDSNWVENCAAPAPAACEP